MVRKCAHLFGIGIGVGIGVDSDTDGDPDPEWVAGDEPALEHAERAMGMEERELDCEFRLRIRRRYLLHRPGGYASGGDPVPLLIFLHGAGERGDDLSLVGKHGVPRELAAGRELPFLVVAPQCPADAWWDPVSLNALYDEVVAAHRVDRSRVYLTGLSMGGFGTWMWANENPEKFAAIAPVCGPGPWIAPARFRDLPVWCFHGALDSVVTVDHSIRKVREVRAAGGQVRFTVYPDAEHDSWTETYRNPELYAWFLSHRKAHSAAARAAARPEGLRQ